MSANNQILIKKVSDKWEISDVCVETGFGITIDATSTLEDAIGIANEYMKEEEVEYGLRIIN